jgi:hypothetical protein
MPTFRFVSAMTELLKFDVDAIWRPDSQVYCALERIPKCAMLPGVAAVTWFEPAANGGHCSIHGARESDTPVASSVVFVDEETALPIPVLADENGEKQR